MLIALIGSARAVFECKRRHMLFYNLEGNYYANQDNDLCLNIEKNCCTKMDIKIIRRVLDQELYPLYLRQRSNSKFILQLLEKQVKVLK